MGGTVTFDLGNLLDMVEVAVHFNDRFATFEQALQARQREEEQRQREEELFVNPSGGGIRNDSEGLGHFGAPRRDEDRKTRLHLGIDFSTTVGQDIVSPIAGSVRNFKGVRTKYPMLQIYPARPHVQFDYIEMLYVNTPQGVQKEAYRNVPAGGLVGTAMRLQELGYSPGVTPHVHLQMYKGRQRIDPTPFFFSKADKS